MVHEFSLRILPREAADNDRLKACVCRLKGLDESHVTGVQLLKRSVDARQRTVMMQVQVRVFENEPVQPPQSETIHYEDVSQAPPVVVVGAGPAGLFAALRLIELHRRPIVVERGKAVRERKRDLAQAVRRQQIDEQSNYCFGEGGAGAFSDGKLYTRSKKRGNVRRILQLFHQFGASENILLDAHPHIGTDKLPGIIANLLQQILDCGGEVHFQTRMTDILLRDGRAVGIRCQGGEEFHGPVILATGHSARDVYELMHRLHMPLEAKGFAMGVRLEHPQALIDCLMYHNPQGRGEYLPAAEYSFVEQVDGRGVYSFCMCPGGLVVPAGNTNGALVVNGMSPSNRGTKWANSGMVVEIRPEDLPLYAGFVRRVMQNSGNAAQDAPVFRQMLQLQQALEIHTYRQVAQGLRAPAQRMADFVQGRASASLPTSSYLPGLVASPLHEWLPGEIRRRLQQGFRLFDRNIKGFLTNEAQLIACETRTSSPLRMLRDPGQMNLLGIEGLYPCGEGAGYAGGIVSSAIDGELCAERCAGES